MLAVLIVPTVLLYTFFIRAYATDREIYYVLDAFNTHLFWIFPILSTIIFYYLVRSEDKNVASRTGSVCIANFVVMYLTVFIYAVSTAKEYRLSNNILEQEIAGFHVIMFVIGMFLCWFFGKKVIPKIGSIV
jgi:hypothetical protein